MENFEIVLLIACSLLAVTFIVVRTLWGGHFAFLLKTVASFALVATTFISVAYLSEFGNIRLCASLIGIGLLLGMIGDMVLDLKVIYNNDAIYLNAGLLSFGLGHLAYFSAFSLYAIENNIDLTNPILIALGIAILLTFVIMLSSKKMKLDFAEYTYQTIIYTFLLTFMTIFTLVLDIYNPAMWILFIGMFAFFISDIVLSMQYFGGKLKNKPLIAINHTLYYTAQILILCFVMLL